VRKILLADRKSIAEKRSENGSVDKCGEEFMEGKFE